MAREKKTGGRATKAQPERIETRGRKTKLTPEVHDKIIAAIRAGNYAVVAAAYAGVSERTFYRWLGRGAEEKEGIFWQFRQAIEKAEGEAEVRAVAIIQKHMEISWQAAMTYLERKYPDRWARRTRIEFRAPEDPLEEIGKLLGMSREEIDKAFKGDDE